MRNFLTVVGYAQQSLQWMLFPKAEEVTRTWKAVVEAVTTDRLGPIAKVAPDDGKDERLSKTCTHSQGYSCY